MSNTFKGKSEILDLKFFWFSGFDVDGLLKLHNGVRGARHMEELKINSNVSSILVCHT